MTRPLTVQPRDPGEVSIGGKRYRCKPPINERRITQVASPIRTGNVERSDQQIASEVIWDSLTGGLGVFNMDEREHPDRFMFASAITHVPQTLMPPLLVSTVTQVGAAFDVSDMIIGACDAIVNGTQFTFVVGGTVVKRVNSTPTMTYYVSATGWTNTGSEYALPYDAQSDPITWKTSAAGYPYLWVATFDGSANGRLVRFDTNSTAAPTEYNLATIIASGVFPKYLFIFDEDLAVLCTNGAVYSTDAVAPAAAADWTSRGSIDTFSSLNGVVVHRNLAGEPAPIVASNRGLHILDWWGGKFQDLGISFSDGNVDNGKGITVWDGDLWFGRGANAHQVTSGARIVRGPNTGEGLLKEYQGRVVLLENSFDNFLVAAIDPVVTGTCPSIVMYNRRGWHNLVTPNPYFHVSGSADFYDVFTRANGAIGTSSSGHAWTTVTGTWEVDTNKAKLATSGGANNVTYLESSVADCMIEVTISGGVTTPPPGAGIIFRYSGASDYFYVEIPSATNTLRLIKKESGTDTVLDTWVMPPALIDDTSVTFTIHLTGDLIQVRWNDAIAMFAVSSFNNTATKHGLWASSSVGTDARWDDFYISDDRSRMKLLHFSSTTTPGFLYFNEGDLLKYVKIPDTTDNPLQFTASSFMRGGIIILPKFDANLAEVQKTGLSAKIRSIITNTLGTSHRVRLQYTIDDGESWTPLYDSAEAQGYITSTGSSTRYLDVDRLGTLFYNVRLRIDFAGRATTSAPRVIFTSLRYLREFDILYGWDLTLDLTQGAPDGRSPMKALADLRASLEAKKIVEFAYWSGETSVDVKEVILLSYGSQLGMATQKIGTVKLTLAEVNP